MVLDLDPKLAVALEKWSHRSTGTTDEKEMQTEAARVHDLASKIGGKGATQPHDERPGLLRRRARVHDGLRTLQAPSQEVVPDVLGNPGHRDLAGLSEGRSGRRVADVADEDSTGWFIVSHG